MFYNVEGTCDISKGFPLNWRFQRKDYYKFQKLNEKKNQTLAHKLENISEIVRLKEFFNKNSDNRNLNN